MQEKHPQEIVEKLAEIKKRKRVAIDTVPLPEAGERAVNPEPVMTPPPPEAGQRVAIGTWPTPERKITVPIPLPETEKAVAPITGPKTLGPPGAEEKALTPIQMPRPSPVSVQKGSGPVLPGEEKALTPIQMPKPPPEPLPKEALLKGRKFQKAKSK